MLENHWSKNVESLYPFDKLKWLTGVINYYGYLTAGLWRFKKLILVKTKVAENYCLCERLIFIVIYVFENIIVCGKGFYVST